MTALVLALTLFAQGTVLQNENGTITGVLKTSAGQPAVGIRVAAMAIPESALDAVTGAAMASLVATDEAGRYRLENVPPGRYYITAGRVDFPTYFPGALDMSAGTIVAVTAKATITDMNFALQDASIRTAATDPSLVLMQPALSVPILVQVENGGKQPVFSNGSYVTLGLTRTADGQRNEIPLSGPAMNAAVPYAIVGAEYRITVNNLPHGYILKSLTYGSTDLMIDTLKLTAANFLQLTNGIPAPVTNGLTLSINGTTFTVNFRAPSIATTLTPASTPPLSGVASNAINVTLGIGPSTAPPSSGVRITGRAPVNGAWAIYRGDTPGTFFADGTFELNGVPPGRHVILLQDNSSTPRFYAALANVSDRNLDGVVLDSTSILPTSDVGQAATAGTPTSTGAQALAGLFGRIVEEADGRPIPQGSITFLGVTRTTIPIGQDGKFFLPHLLPGSYDLRVEVYEHFTRYETVVIDDKDVHIELAVRSNLATAEERATSQAEPPQ
jgi:5-hydroxyisourate hydrolase-like protein (transthyretin family)